MMKEIEEIMDYSWIGGLIIINPIDDIAIYLGITNQGNYNGMDFIIKNGAKFYAPIIEENGNFYTEEEYYSSSVE